MKGLCIDQITLQGFSVYAGPAQTLFLPDRGIVLVTGANGSGKSSVVDAVATALWNETVRGTSGWIEGSAGRVVVAGTGLSVARTRTPSGGTKLAWDADGYSEVFESMTKAQEQLNLRIGSFEQWRRTHVLCADDGEAFTRAPDSARKVLLERLLGIEGFDNAYASAGRDRRDADRQASAALVKLDTAEKTLVRLETYIEQAPPTRDVMEARAKVDLLRAEYEGAIRAQHAAREAASNARAEVMSASVALRSAQDIVRAFTLRDLGDSCPRCFQTIPAEHRDAVLAGDCAELARLEGIEHHKAAHAAELAAQHAPVISAEGAANARCYEIERKLIHARADLKAIEESAKVAQMKAQWREEYFDVSDQRDEAAKITETAHQEIAELSAVERLLGPNGVRSLVLADALTTLTGLTNEWLAKISTGRPLSVSIEPYAEKASGGIKNAVSIKVTGAGKGTYKSCSRGEQRRIDIAVLLGIAELSALVAGVEPGTMFVDEILDAIDDEGAVAVCAALREMARDRCIVIITHNESVKAALRPEHSLVIRDGTVSKA